MVGAAAEPMTYESGPALRRTGLPALLLHPLRALPPADEHFEPEEDYLEELIREDRRRVVRRRVAWSLSIVLLLSGLIGAIVAAYQWTQTRYYVGDSNGLVAIYQGVPEEVWVFPLSTLYEETSISIDDLPPYQQDIVLESFPTESLDDAKAFIERLGAR
jgi:protein phosphatase